MFFSQLEGEAFKELCGIQWAQTIYIQGLILQCCMASPLMTTGPLFKRVIEKKQ